MMNDYRTMWTDLGLDLKRHDAMLEALPAIYEEVYLSQEHRPTGMEYFDFVVSEIHGARVKELVDHKIQGGKVIGTFCVYVPEEVIVASGAIGVGLCGGLDLTVPDGERVLPRNLCPLIKSAFGFKVARMCPTLRPATSWWARPPATAKRRRGSSSTNTSPPTLWISPRGRRRRTRKCGSRR